VLQGGVLLAALIVAAGGILHLAAHGSAIVDYHVFRGEPPAWRSMAAIVRGTLALQGESMIALGLLVLIATPIARVVLLLVAFLAQRDRVYTLVTGVVLTVLLISLVSCGVPGS
jgi:uncharacterized membrane protein